MMLQTKSCGEQNPLIRRVRQHSALTTLFRTTIVDGRRLRPSPVPLVLGHLAPAPAPMTAWPAPVDMMPAATMAADETVALSEAHVADGSDLSITPIAQREATGAAVHAPSLPAPTIPAAAQMGQPAEVVSVQTVQHTATPTMPAPDRHESLPGRSEQTVSAPVQRQHSPNSVTPPLSAPVIGLAGSPSMPFMTSDDRPITTPPPVQATLPASLASGSALPVRPPATSAHPSIPQPTSWTPVMGQPVTPTTTVQSQTEAPTISVSSPGVNQAVFVPVAVPVQRQTAAPTTSQALATPITSVPPSGTKPPLSPPDSVQRQVEPNTPAVTGVTAVPSDGIDDRTWTRLQSAFRKAKAQSVEDNALSGSGSAPTAALRSPAAQVQRLPTPRAPRRTLITEQPTNQPLAPVTPLVDSPRVAVDANIPAATLSTSTPPAVQRESAPISEGASTRVQPAVDQNVTGATPASAQAHFQASDPIGPVAAAPELPATHPSSRLDAQQQPPVAEVVSTQRPGAIVHSPAPELSAPLLSIPAPPMNTSSAIPEWRQGQPVQRTPAPAVTPEVTINRADQATTPVGQPHFTPAEPETPVVAAPWQAEWASATADQALPLDAVWPVQRLVEPMGEATSAVHATSSAPTEELPPSVTAAIRQQMATPPTARPTDSKVDFIAPRRPRPVLRSAAPTATETATPAVAMREVQSTATQPEPLPADGAPPAFVPTEIGPLPADLWRYIGEPPPQTPLPVSTAPVPSVPPILPTTVTPQSAAPVTTASVQTAPTADPVGVTPSSATPPPFVQSDAVAPVAALPVQRKTNDNPMVEWGPSAWSTPALTPASAVVHDEAVNDKSAERDIKSLLPSTVPAAFAEGQFAASTPPVTLSAPQAANPATPATTPKVQRQAAAAASAPPAPAVTTGNMAPTGKKKRRKRSTPTN